MSKSRISIVAVVAVIAAAAAFGVYKLALPQQQSQLKTSLATGYATQPLTTPFTLTSKNWHAGSSSWEYDYSSSQLPADAIATAKTQLGRGAYQVIATRADVVGSTTATLYRDLITEDIAVTTTVSPNPAAAGPRTIVTVTLTKQSGGS